MGEWHSTHKKIVMTLGIQERIEERIRDWSIEVDEIFETSSSLIAYGNRGGQPVVLKVIRTPGDEWCSGAVLDVFDGIYEYTEGAVLLERLNPGTSLADLALAGRDEEAREIISNVIRQMAHAGDADAGNLKKTFATVEDWGKGFDRYRATGDCQIPQALLDQGQALYSELCASQKEPRLLHGDLQHYNILLDSQRGWTAIDPKGVVGA
jgi:streptomycin 6-kinase